MLMDSDRERWNLREFTQVSAGRTLQVSSARASHFLDAVTCEFLGLY